MMFFCVVHEAMNGYKILMIHKRLALKMKILFDVFQKWLKVGGKLFISDYCCSDTEHTDHFKAYVKQRGYNLMSPAAYGKVGILKNSDLWSNPALLHSNITCSHQVGRKYYQGT